MSDFVIVAFILIVFYFIGSSALFYESSGSSVLSFMSSCFQTRNDRNLEEASKWDSNARFNQTPKVPAMYLEGLESRETNNIPQSETPILRRIETSDKELDNYGEEPLNDRFLNLTTSTKYSDNDLLNIILSRTHELPEEEEVYREDIRTLERNEHDLSGADLNNRIVSKVKKNNQLAERNTNCKIPLSAIRDDMELDYAGLEDDEPWWADNSSFGYKNIM